MKTYLEAHEGLRTSASAFLFVLASIALFSGFSIHFLLFKADEHSTLFLLCMLISFLLDLIITWILIMSSDRTFGRTFLVVTCLIPVGALLVSIVVWRSHWWQLIRELV